MSKLYYFATIFGDVMEQKEFDTLKEAQEYASKRFLNLSTKDGDPYDYND